MNTLLQALGVIFSNILGYDMLVLLAAVVCAVYYALSHRVAKALYLQLHRTIFVPDAHPALSSPCDLSETALVLAREKAQRFYQVFVNLIGIFPLLGILGTVIALLPMVNDLSNIQTNFFAALTSTFWGLVFAIIFKVLDGLIAPLMEDNEKNLSLLLERGQCSGGDPCEKE